MNALYAERTGDDTARQRAVASLNYATYFTDEDGRVVCCGDDFPNGYWFDDGYSDYTRSFNWAMAALPELAPRRQDHLLGSSSVIQRVSYGRRSLSYRAFDGKGVEVLRLGFRPRAVTADGRPLAERPGLDAEGFTVATAGGGDFVVRIRRDAARSVAVI